MQISRNRKFNSTKLGWLRVTMGITYFFLYVPIIALVGMSFNASDSPFTWNGFSTKWYGVLVNDSTVMKGLTNTLIVAFTSTFLATILGTALAVGLHQYTKSSFLNAFALAPAIMPDIVLGIGLLALFALLSMTLGLYSVVIAHVVFSMAFVSAVVKARLSNSDPALREASMDLGATRSTTFFKITLPSLTPAIVAGALLAFTLSLDEFVIAFFTNGPATPTLPIIIYSMVRFGVTPEINALASLLMLVSFTAVIGAQRMTKLAEAQS